MSPIEAIRWGWTFLTGFGVLFAAWNFRESLVDNWAVSQVRTRPVDILRLQVRAEVNVHALILLALLANFVAGLCSLFNVPVEAIAALVASAIALVLLSFDHTRRRRKIFEAIKLRPREE